MPVDIGQPFPRQAPSSSGLTAAAYVEEEEEEEAALSALLTWSLP